MRSNSKSHGVTERVAALIAVLCLLGNDVVRNVIVHNFITADRSESITAAFAYLVLGSWTGVTVSLVLSRFLGRVVDPNYQSITLKNGLMHRQAFLSGSLSSVGTFFLLLGNQYGDPGVVVTLMSALVLYVAGWEILMRKLKWYKILAPLAVTFVGILLATTSADIRTMFSNSHLEISTTLVGLLVIVLVFSNTFTAASEISDQTGVRASDAVSFFLWRFFYFAVSATLLAIAVELYRGSTRLLIATILASLGVIPIICVAMCFNYFGIGTAIRLKIRNAVTVVLLITAARLAVVVPVTFLGDELYPGIFGLVPTDNMVWIERAIGAGLIAFVAFYLRSQLDKASKHEDRAIA